MHIDKKLLTLSITLYFSIFLSQTSENLEEMKPEDYEEYQIVDTSTSPHHRWTVSVIEEAWQYAFVHVALVTVLVKPYLDPSHEVFIFSQDDRGVREDIPRILWTEDDQLQISARSAGLPYVGALIMPGLDISYVLESDDVQQQNEYRNFFLKYPHIHFSVKPHS